jgi:hypothetical protein
VLAGCWQGLHAAGRPAQTRSKTNTSNHVTKFALKSGLRRSSCTPVLKGNTESAALTGSQYSASTLLQLLAKRWCQLAYMQQTIYSMLLIAAI